MEKITRLGLVFVALLVIVPVILSCEKQQATSSVTIGTFSQAIDYAPFYVSRHFKWFEENLKAAGVTVQPTYIEYAGFNEIETAFAQNGLQAFFCAEAPSIKIRSDKQDIRVVEVGCTLQQEILVRGGQNISSLAELKGKKIAVARGTSSHFGLLKILSTSGMSEKDVLLQDHFPGTAKPLFESGQVDAWAVWPPFVEEQVAAQRGNTLQGGDAKIHSIMVVPANMMRDKPKIAQALVDAIQKAKKWIAANPDEAQSIVAKELKLDVNVVKMAWPKHNWGATLTDDVINDMQDKSRFLTDQKVVQDGVVINVRNELIDKRYIK